MVNTHEEAHIASAASPSLVLWHCRFGECEACTQGKMHRFPFPKTSEKKTSPSLELIHSDLRGPMHLDSIGGTKYVLTLTDDYTRYVKVYFIKSKSKVLSKFVEYVRMAENETGL